MTGTPHVGKGGEALLAKLMTVVRQLATQVTERHGACRVLTNLGDYQDSKHLLFPVCSGDPLRAE